MTKILYIPTGQYLKFYDSNTTYPTEIEWEKLNTFITVEEKFKSLTVGKVYCSEEWLATNNVILPILKLEIEIIYD